VSEIERIDKRLERMEAMLSAIMQNGCSKAESHARVEKNQETIFNRLWKVEITQAEGRGRLVIVSTIIGVVLSTVAAYIGRHL
jgi:hypothetical protein